MITIETLRLAGLTDQQIVKVLELDQKERLAARREQNRINKRNQRSRQHVSADRADIDDTPPPPFSPPSDSPPYNPPRPPKDPAFEKRGSRLPSDWQPSDADRAYARSEGLSEADIEREAGGFRDYWCAKPGKDGLKLDWSATWRNRVRSFLGRRQNGVTYHGKPHRKTVHDVFRELAERTSPEASPDDDGLLPFG